MAREVEIIKQDIVVIHPDPQNMSEDESYLHFADQSGAMHRIKKNRTSAVELIKNNPGKAVSLNYGSYMNKEYIHTVDLVGDKLPPGVEPPKDMTPPRGIPQIAPQEKGMWWKEVGENFRAGLFKKDDDGNGALLWRAYVTQMLASLEINIKSKKEE